MTPNEIKRVANMSEEELSQWREKYPVKTIGEMNNKELWERYHKVTELCNWDELEPSGFEQFCRRHCVAIQQQLIYVA